MVELSLKETKLLKLCLMLHSCKPCESAKDQNSNPNWDLCTRRIYDKLVNVEQILNDEAQETIITKSCFEPISNELSENSSSPIIEETCLTCASARCDLDACNDVDCNYHIMWDFV